MKRIEIVMIVAVLLVYAIPFIMTFGFKNKLRTVVVVMFAYLFTLFIVFHYLKVF